jgi:hypothetical protein
MSKWIKRFWDWIRGNNPTPQPTPGTDPAPVPDSADDLQISGIARWLGPDFRYAQINGRIVSAEMNEKFMYTGIEPYTWPRKDVSGVECDAQCCIFYYRDGKIIGGKFDWHQTGGQPVKTLENLHHGYNGHTMPIRAGYVWTMNVSVDGKWRTNIKAVTWK